MDSAILVALLIVLVIVLVWKGPSIMSMIGMGKNSGSTYIPETPVPPPVAMGGKAERLDNPTDLQNTSQKLNVDSGVSWNDQLAATEVDPGTIASHQDFVKDVKRFSSGANFTSVTDDNTNAAFTNFRGLRRPQHVPIGVDARQVPDVDETVLMRNKDFRW